MSFWLKAPLTLAFAVRLGLVLLNGSRDVVMMVVVVIIPCVSCVSLIIALEGTFEGTCLRVLQRGAFVVVAIVGVILHSLSVVESPSLKTDPLSHLTEKKMNKPYACVCICN